MFIVYDRDSDTIMGHSHNYEDAKELANELHDVQILSCGGDFDPADEDEDDEASESPAEELTPPVGSTIRHTATDASTGNKIPIMISVDHNGLVVNLADGRHIIFDLDNNHFSVYFADEQENPELLHRIDLVELANNPPEPESAQ